MEGLDACQTTCICWTPSRETRDSLSAPLPDSFQTSGTLCQERDLLTFLHY